AAVKDASGLPWACCITPFAGEHLPGPAVPIDQVARCATCYAYINPSCELAPRWWRCPLCGEHNAIKPTMQRYRAARAGDTLPELTQQVVEYELPLDSKGAMLQAGEFALNRGYLAKEPAADRPVVHLAVVDENGGAAYLAAVADALAAAAAALPPEARFALVLASDRVGLFDLAAPLPHVHFVDVRARAAAEAARGSADIAHPTDGPSVDLADVMLFEELACPVGPHRSEILAAVAALPQVCRGAEAAEAAAVAAAAGAAAAGAAVTRRCIGTALHLLLELIMESRGPPPAAVTAPGDPAVPVGFSGGSARPATAVGGPAIGVRRRFTYAGVQIMLFLGGKPDGGAGAVADADADADALAAADEAQASATAPTEGSAAWAAAERRSASFFRGQRKAAVAFARLAAAAATNGVSFDVHAVAAGTGEFFALSALRPLALLTGGRLHRHVLPTPRGAGDRRSAALAVALAAAAARPAAYDALLRAFCMDFEFSGGDSAGADDDGVAVVQVAFAYTAIIPDPDEEADDAQESNGGGGDRKRPRLVTVRRLRVFTTESDMSADAAVVGAAVDVAATPASLLHKVAAEAMVSGFFEARSLLRDWLCNYCYALVSAARHGGYVGAGARHPNEPGGADGPGLQSMAALLREDSCARLLRQVYGMLHSPLLRSDGVHPDERAALHSALGALDPAWLRLALYPSMQGFADENWRLATELPLSRETNGGAAAAFASGSGIFVIDALDRVVVYRPGMGKAAATDHARTGTSGGGGGGGSGGTPAAASGDAWVPSASSSLGQFLAVRPGLCHVTPEVVFCTAGDADEYFVQRALLEDDGLGEMGAGFGDFVRLLVADVDASLAGGTE
ncbi:unnamed protein product, partial [Phaeothamnion confervicola]